MQICIENATRRVIAWGDQLTDPASADYTLVTVSDSVAAKIRDAGGRSVLNAKGDNITKTKDDPTAPAAAPNRDAAIAALKAAASGTDATAGVARATLTLLGIT